jgi:hypothetical protein
MYALVINSLPPASTSQFAGVFFAIFLLVLLLSFYKRNGALYFTHTILCIILATTSVFNTLSSRVYQILPEDVSTSVLLVIAFLTTVEAVPMLTAIPFAFFVLSGYIFWLFFFMPAGGSSWRLVFNALAILRVALFGSAACYVNEMLKKLG